MVTWNFSSYFHFSPLFHLVLISLYFILLNVYIGGKLHSNLSRMATVVWLFVALILVQTYVANLTSILTVQRLEPTVADVESLRNGNAMVGYCRGSFVANYLKEVLNIHQNNIKNYNSPEEYAEALRSQEIAAAFLEAPFAKLFLAKYCKEFIISGPTYKVGGFGFVSIFPTFFFFSFPNKAMQPSYKLYFSGISEGFSAAS
jgi:hypothetical protein